jgi:hypothetical protein
MIDLIKKDEEEDLISPMIKSIQNKKEQPVQKSPMIDVLEKSQYLQTGTTIPSPQPKQPLQDIAKITPEPVQAPAEPVMGTAGYVGGKVYSILIEKPVAAMAAPVSSVLEKGFRLFGLNTLADQQAKVTELYNNPPITQNVKEQTAYLREQAYGKGMLQGVGFDVTESVTQLIGLLTQIAATKKIPALQGKDIMDTFKIMAGHAVATTPGGIEDRLKAAVYRVGYSMTPFIANSTGATGLTAVTVDTMLNTFLTSPTYMEAYKKAKSPEEFFQMAIPQLVMDIGMAWNTRGYPANQKIAEYNKMWSKVEGQVSKLKPEEFVKLSEEVDKIYQAQQKAETEVKPETTKPVAETPTTEKPAESGKLEIPEFIQKAENVSKETDQIVQKMIEDKFQELKVIRDMKLSSDKGIIKDSEGRTIDRYNLSNRPLWYQELQKELGRKPNITELREEAIRQLREQDIDFVRMEASRDAYQNVKETWEESNIFVDKPESNFTEDERGSIILPSREMVSDTVTKLKSFWDVEVPFIKAGASETGFRIKNYYSEIETGLTRGTEVIQNITSQGRKTGFTDTDYAEVTFATESPVYKLKLDSETRNKVEPIVKQVNEFYKTWEGKLKEIGWMEEPFPQSLVSRNNKLIDDYKKRLQTELPKEEADKLHQEIINLQATNQKIKDIDLQFVSVPIRMILEGADTAVSKHFMSILPHWGRKTLTIKDLVDEGVLTREQADIRNIVAEYSDRMSRKYALGQIFKSAEEDGLIATASEKPEWSEFNAKIVPQLKGKVLHPAFNDMLTAYFGVMGNPKGLNVGNLIGITKMMQFYNPLFLPMYDVIQGFAGGAYTSKNTPKSIKQALGDMPLTIGKYHKPASENYIEAMENGLFSTPFTINYKEYTEQVKGILSNQKFRTAVSKFGKNPVMGLYQLSWDTAWKGDQFVRMITYNHLKNNGMESREAAQIAAKFHGDYASVPPSTRKTLNKVFFTPTFKITMVKAYEEMAKGALKTAFTPSAADSKDKTYAKGLLLATAFLEGRRYFFTHVLGYEEEQRYRRYVKEVETDEGIKESVITVADPLNIPWRYYYRGKSAIDDPDLNKVSKLFDQVKYDMTPVLQVGFELIENRYDNVYKEGDDAERQLASAVLFITKELVGITKPLIEAQQQPDEFKTESWKVMQKELGTLTSLILQPFIFHYARDTKDKRLSLMIYRLQNNFRMALRTAESPEQQQRIVNNFYKELDKLNKELDNYYSNK